MLPKERKKADGTARKGSAEAMSTRLVQERLQRISLMRNQAKFETVASLKTGNDGFIAKDRFLARYMVHQGVREKLTNEYYQTLVKAGIFEEGQTGFCFVSVDGKEEFEREKAKAN